MFIISDNDVDAKLSECCIRKLNIVLGLVILHSDNLITSYNADISPLKLCSKFSTKARHEHKIIY